MHTPKSFKPYHHSTSGENEEECAESTEEEVIDLTREDEEDVGQEQQSPNTENASQGIVEVVSEEGKSLIILSPLSEGG